MEGPEKPGRGRGRGRGRGQSPVTHDTDSDIRTGVPEKQISGKGSVHTQEKITEERKHGRVRGRGRGYSTVTHDTDTDIHASPTEKNISGESPVHTPDKITGERKAGRGRGRGRDHSPVSHDTDSDIHAPPPAKNISGESPVHTPDKITGERKSGRGRGRGRDHSPVSHDTDSDIHAPPPVKNISGESPVHTPGKITGERQPGRGGGREKITGERKPGRGRGRGQCNSPVTHDTVSDIHACHHEKNISGESPVHTPGGSRSIVKQIYVAPQPEWEKWPKDHRTEKLTRRQNQLTNPDLGAVSKLGSQNARKIHVPNPCIDSVREEAHSSMPRGSSVNRPCLRNRPGFGTIGRPINLTSNCFPLEFPSGNVYHYAVQITRANVTVDDGAGKKYRRLKNNINREIVKTMLRNDPAFKNMPAAYDGQSNLYTRNPLLLPFPHNFVVPEWEDKQHRPQPGGAFEVKIEPVKKNGTLSCAINLNSIHDFYHGKTNSVQQDAIMVLETILLDGPSMRFTPIGRSFFYPPKSSFPKTLKDGLEVWFGYHQSIKMGQWKPIINIDVKHTTFIGKGPLLDYIAKFKNIDVESLRWDQSVTDIDIKNISKVLNGLEVETKHLRYPKKYRMIGLINKNANELHFEDKVKGITVQKSVTEYFKDRYKIDLEFPHLPCLLVKPKERKIYLPVEVCYLPEEQHYKKSLTPEQISQMIKFTSVEPKERFSNIGQIAHQADFNIDQCAKGFNLRVSSRPLNLEGRVLKPPRLKYKENELEPMDGSWNMIHNQFFMGAEIKSWVFLSFARIHYTVLDKFSEMLVQTGKNLGMVIHKPAYTNYVSVKCNPRELLQDMKEKYGADFVLMVVSTSKEIIYNRIKEAAEKEIGIATQFVLQANVEKCTDPNRSRSTGLQLVSNLCLKINTKTGGINNSLVKQEIPSILWKPVIIIGADVSHPEPTTNSEHSLAACVGSLNFNLTRYWSTIRPQKHRNDNKKAVEIIVELSSMVKELLLAFYDNTNGKKPEKIILYRDGVSEGQLAIVRSYEVESIRKACKILNSDYEPGITVIVVQKRHHVRFMPLDPRDGVGRKGNVPPGTVVDTQVVHPEHFDFYLSSHYGHQGTSRPAHYTVVHDDNDFSADDIQKFTNQMCYMSVRCTKSISIPAPVYYADLLAYRGRKYLYALENESSDSSSTMATEITSLSKEEVINAVKVLEEMKNSMFYV